MLSTALASRSAISFAARLDALALGDVADGRGDEKPASLRDGAQAHLDGELAAVLAAAEELEPGAHRARPGVGEEARRRAPRASGGSARGSSNSSGWPRSSARA